MIQKYLTKDYIFLNSAISSRDELFLFAARKAEKKSWIESEDIFYKGLVDREEQGSTEMKSGIAIPHAKLESVRKIFIMFFVLKTPIKFSPGLGKGVDFFIIIGAPKDDPVYINVLASIARLLEKEDFIKSIRNAHVVEDILHAIDKYSIDEKSLEPGKTRYLITLILHVKFPAKTIHTFFLELGVQQAVLFNTENLTASKQFGLPFLGISAIDLKGNMKNSMIIQGISDDKDVVPKLNQFLKNEGIDLAKPGIGALYSMELHHCFGGINAEIDI